MNDETIAQIDQWLKDGTLPNDIAVKLGMSRNTMEKRLLRLGYEIDVEPAKRRLKRISLALEASGGDAEESLAEAA